MLPENEALYARGSVRIRNRQCAECGHTASSRYTLVECGARGPECVRTNSAKAEHVFISSRSVNEGHPDKICDLIANAFLDACLSSEPMGRVACETCVEDNRIVALCTSRQVESKLAVKSADNTRGEINVHGPQQSHWLRASA